MRGAPCMCIKQTGTAKLAAVCSALGARRAKTSLMMDAPPATASRMTAGLLVSMEIGTSTSRRTDSMTGMTRSSSAATLTGNAPGRVDSPPMSMMSAPSSASLTAWLSAWSRSVKRPPSENESGVTLRTPITRQRRSSRGRGKPLRGSQRATVGGSMLTGRLTDVGIVLFLFFGPGGHRRG